ncbi:MAG: serine protease [Chloroflexota bacterium]
MASANLIKNTLPAVVQIVALRQGFMGNLSSAWTGSGTIVHPQGVILTNCHVANPRAMGMPSPPADKLAIAITERSDEPPVLTYIAEIVVQSPEMDLAVLRIASRMDGKSVHRLNLPAVPIGDSDSLELGDVMSIFGYPGIGGETVTFTSGSVSGFTQQRDVTSGRAWIKTDATIAGGNSGGTSVNNQGYLVGIPTQAAAGTGISPVDARPVVDTNQDGRVDQRDTPMSIGGFINGLRPVNMAKPLLQKAGMQFTSGSRKRSTGKSTEKSTNKSSSRSKSKSAGKTVVESERGTSPEPKKRSGRLAGLKSGERPTAKSKTKAITPTITDLVFCDRVTKDGRPVNPSAILPGGKKQIYASFEFDGMRNRTKWGQVWSVDGQKVYEDEAAWSDGPRGRKTLAVQSRKPLPDGKYHLAIYVKGAIIAEGEVTVGRPNEDADIQISGQVIDRDTNRGINDALVIVLKPGIRTSDFIKKQEREMALTSTKTKRAGRFTLPDQLPKGQAYGLVVVARGYQDMAIESALRISPQAPEKAQIHPVPMVRE